MAGPPPRLEIETCDGVAADDRATIGAGRLGHEDEGMARGLRLDQRACRRRADLLVRREEDRHRQGCLDPRRQQLPQRVDVDVIAALHVHQTRSVTEVALAPKRQHAKRAHGMHGVEMAQQQDAALSASRMGHRRSHAVPKAHAPWDTLDPAAHGRQLVLRQIHHPVDGGGVEGRALGLDPRAKALDHLVRVEREGEGVRAHDTAFGRRASTRRAKIDAPTGRIASSSTKAGLCSGTDPAWPTRQYAPGTSLSMSAKSSEPVI